LGRCIEAALGQADYVYLVDNSDDLRYLYATDPFVGVTVLPGRGQPPNLSRLWNLGLNAAYRHAFACDWETFDVAVLNDDAIIQPGWFEKLSAEMRGFGCHAAGFGPVLVPTVHLAPGMTRLEARMPGWAFLLRGETGLLADERLQWWCGDNDLDMQARVAGGTLILPGEQMVQHLYPDQSTAASGELMRQTGVDMATFVQKWGFRPWVI
jgi:hypothetical protein